ncbi:MetQ/NlpA family ABC transporter substrate-binding protein [Priestia endophytica]|jgi:D-methionine transport system substrate-binding protein|uniref:Lipoprotein n=2 Tax=Priestia endophytica TaxID=135735 RepID=A0AAX1Q602_9BACI|nr:MetQ/NlpA family ABC transporter substrate-binding protein [Priestia endophytica]KAB2492276.1 MetQ/NlpA family ABC transporter substrate-binding protein [Priestia endophytica]KYG28363.1 methionine ABC transporter substrate-binding protein [Priestia endophytica]MBG9810575.1 methionine ABC transporter substrate-binding protein [Priestia endophytica]MCM3540104.1 MetQ/NlpA family ABC transporter substrate-binding protein [Priestia endophytica]RAS74720.1 methionine ABC transporter substrate-bind
MKKLFASAVLALSVTSLAACGSSGGSDSSKEKEIKIVATSTPHAEILEEAASILEKKDIKLDVEVNDDYSLQNKMLASGEVDANFFQHTPYLKNAMKEDKSFDLVSAGGVHLEPMGVYSKKYKNLDEIPKNGTIMISNNVAEEGRMLSLLQQGGLIKLKEGVDAVSATKKDIVENKKNINIKVGGDAALMPKAYENEEADAVIINTNYAIGADLTPTKDAIELEGEDSPYVNIVAVKKGDEDREEIKELMKVLHSKEIQDFIKEKYKGSIIPVSK